MIERAVPGTAVWEDLYADHVSRYLFACGYAKDKSVLDVGTGPGYGARMLKESGATSVQAIDIDQTTVNAAAASYSIQGVSFMVDDAQTLSQVKGPVDLVCSFENIEHVQRPEQFLASAARLLSDGGVLLCSTPDRAFTDPYENGRPRNPFHVQEWYREEFAALLGRYFNDVEIRVQAISRSLERRQEATRALAQHLNLLWSNPVSRMQRFLASSMGRAVAWPDIRGLACASTFDYPIVSAHLAPLIGRAFCHFAICKNRKQ